MKRDNQTQDYQKEFIATASTFRRIVAFMIDVTIINTIASYPFRPFIDSLKLESMSQAFQIAKQVNEGALTLTIVSIIISFITLFYFAFLEWRIGQTLGKVLMRVYVISTKDRISFWDAILRHIWFVPFLPLSLLLIIDMFYMFTNPERQRLTEKWSKTRVVAYKNYLT